MAGRWMAVAILLAMLAIVGIFLWPLFQPPEPVPAETWQTPGPPASGEKRVTGRAGPWTLYAWAVPGAEGAVSVTVAARDLQERPVASPVPPTAILRMLDMAMDTERIALAQEGSGFWRGAGRVSMAGRWNLRIELNGETVDVPFEVVLRQR
jgi:hypothetical protein